MQLFFPQIKKNRIHHFNIVAMMDFAGDITHVTYNEVAIFWNMDPKIAANRLSTIRSALNKSRFHRLTVSQYCKAEDITLEEFTERINRYYNSQHKKAS